MFCTGVEYTLESIDSVIPRPFISMLWFVSVYPKCHKTHLEVLPETRRAKLNCWWLVVFPLFHFRFETCLAPAWSNAKGGFRLQTVSYGHISRFAVLNLAGKGEKQPMMESFLLDTHMGRMPTVNFKRTFHSNRPLSLYSLLQISPSYPSTVLLLCSPYPVSPT